MIDGKYILDAILSSMTKDEKLSLMASLTTDVGGLQPDSPKRVTPEVVLEDMTIIMDEPIVKTSSGEEEFVMVRSRKTPKKSASKPPEADNLFADNEGLHKGEDYTPPEQPKEPRQRRDPPKKVEQICKRCDDAVMVHEIEARDWFICGNCIKKGKTE